MLGAENSAGIQKAGEGMQEPAHLRGCGAGIRGRQFSWRTPSIALAKSASETRPTMLRGRFVAALEDEHARNAGDAVLGRDVVGVIDVELADLDATGIAGRELVDGRRELPTGAAPGGPKLTTTGISLWETSFCQLSLVNSRTLPPAMDRSFLNKFKLESQTIHASKPNPAPRR